MTAASAVILPHREFVDSAATASQYDPPTRATVSDRGTDKTLKRLFAAFVVSLSVHGGLLLWYKDARLPLAEKTTVLTDRIVLSFTKRPAPSNTTIASGQTSAMPSTAERPEHAAERVVEAPAETSALSSSHGKNMRRPLNKPEKTENRTKGKRVDSQTRNSVAPPAFATVTKTRQTPEPRLAQLSTSKPRTADKQAQGGRENPGGEVGDTRASHQTSQGDPPAGAMASKPNPLKTPLILEPRYRRPPTPPVYPRQAIRRGQQGTVLLRARISASGEVIEVNVFRSSGVPLLDKSAVAAVHRWQFEPAKRDGDPIEAWVQVPVNFVLQ